MAAERITTLFSKYMDSSASEAERLELSALSLEAGNRDLIQELERAYWEKMKEGGEDLSEQEIEKLLTAIGQTNPTKIRVVTLKRIAVAASIFFAVCLGGYFMFFNKGGKKSEEIVTTTPKDVKAPATNRATITLPDGSIIYLDSANNGKLTQQSNVTVTKTADGQIVYSGKATEVVYNTLSNPRGSKIIDMQLSDGSRVWLNAGSSVTYPIAFTGNDRKVTITGEAYFEIVHDQSKPFYVSKGDMSVQVLGTHFNVNAYDDEPVIKVTLLEGSVKVYNDQSSLFIKPNQQAVVANNVTISLNTNVNVEQVMAWKNGKFSFRNTDMKAILREVMRWYDVDVMYDGNVSNRYFTADISREKSLASLLKIFELSNIRFKIEGNKLTVLP